MCAAGGTNQIPGAWPSAGDIDEDSSRMKLIPGYRRYSMAAWVFFFRAISAEGVADADLARLDALGEDLAEREELGVDLAANEGLDAELSDDFDDGVGADLDEDAGADLGERLEVDEEESSVCAP